MYPECFFHLRCKNANYGQSQYYEKSYSHTLTIPSNWSLSWIWAKKALLKHSSLTLYVFSFNKKPMLLLALIIIRTLIIKK